MSERQVDIADIQAWVFRMAQNKWGVSPQRYAEIFAEFDLLGFIFECYDLLHVISYQHALHDIEDILRRKGAL